eukprot:PITA_03602
MKEEMDSLAHNQTWDLVRLPAGKTALQNKWVYRLKEEDGGKQRYKARLVVKGFAQKKGIDFDEIFSLIVKMTSIRTILCLVVVEYLHLQQLDVKTTFLHGDLEKEIYMQQPPGYEVKGKEKLVCRLKKSLYGLKQAPRQWYLKFYRFMPEQGYTRCHSDHCVYLKRKNDGGDVILLLYVDDMLVVGSNMQESNALKIKLANSFTMKDLGGAKQILDMAGDRDNRRSTTGYVFTVGGTGVNWVLKLKSVIALSTIEAEYLAAIEASKEMIWLQRFLDELAKKQELGKLCSDNQNILQRTLDFIPRINIYISSTISYGQH